mgnify:CR=1 FL=1
MLEDHAEELGVVERNRKLQMPALVWSLVFGFATGESRPLALTRYPKVQDDFVLGLPDFPQPHI